MSFMPEKTAAKRSGVNQKSDDSLGIDEDTPANTGAPVEDVSPLGYHVDWVSVIFLNIGKMIGTGVFTTRMVYLSYPALS
jgi:hypothetical protein